MFVILKAFFGPQKSERTRRKYCRSIMTYFAILSYAHFVPILTLFQPEKPQCGKKPCLRRRGYFHSVFVCTSLWLEKHICLYSWKQTWTVSPFNIIFYEKDVCITSLQKRAHWKTSPVKSGVPIRLCEQNEVSKTTVVFGLLWTS